MSELRTTSGEATGGSELPMVLHDLIQFSWTLSSICYMHSILGPFDDMTLSSGACLSPLPYTFSCNANTKLLLVSIIADGENGATEQNHIRVFFYQSEPEW
ncbi:hypothetical protein VNO78_26877 [Psophocarpus tetragonolobus]|uniref:Uncharacterized protein n=1 Tax=Psophocarpus tetragonolobus TaxID=3891 RepID=A0AAN9S037_PSOTE